MRASGIAASLILVFLSESIYLRASIARPRVRQALSGLKQTNLGDRILADDCHILNIATLNTSRIDVEPMQLSIMFTCASPEDILPLVSEQQLRVAIVNGVGFHTEVYTALLWSFQSAGADTWAFVDKQSTA